MGLAIIEFMFYNSLRNKNVYSIKKVRAMPEQKKQYACIDLKSYYASVECVDRGLDPLTTNLVVADESRSDGTICLAVSPSLKAWEFPAAPGLFEVKQRLAEIRAHGKNRAIHHRHAEDGPLPGSVLGNLRHLLEVPLPNQIFTFIPSTKPLWT